MQAKKMAVDIDELNFQNVLDSDLKGWASFFKHPKMPELIQYIQQRHYAELMRDRRNSLLTDDEVKKSVKSRGRAEAYETLITAFCDAMEGLKNA